MNVRQTIRALLTGAFTILLLAGGISTAFAQSPCGDTETVVYGDSLSLIANRCNTTITALMQANPQISNRNLIYVGQVLQIPNQGGEPEAPNTDPDVRLSLTEGSPGTQVTLSAANLTPNAQVEIGFGRVGSEYSILTQAQTGANGQLERSVPIPSFAEPGDTYVFVVQDPAMADELISEEFRVTGESQVVDPQVTISPRSGPSGSNVQLTATGFPANTRVSFGLGEPNAQLIHVESARTNRNGFLSTAVQVPEVIDAGTDLVALVYVPRQGGARATSGLFDVTAQDSGSGNLFNRTNIYLVALQDAGSSGQEIGCGDSVIPVEVEIEPTIAPLTAALENMFAIDSRFYGQSGLYNVFYQSDLSVQGIDINNGAATISLTGDLVLGGVCDNPRMRAQLEETALQYYTIDEVMITVNGESLDSLLSGQN